MAKAIIILLLFLVLCSLCGILGGTPSEKISTEMTPVATPVVTSKPSQKPTETPKPTVDDSALVNALKTSFVDGCAKDGGATRTQCDCMYSQMFGKMNSTQLMKKLENISQDEIYSAALNCL